MIGKVRIAAWYGLLIAAITLGSITVSVATAEAAYAPTCHGSSCEGLNPAETNCVDDAQSIMSREASTEAGNFGLLELRYSPQCYSNWVRFTPWYGARAWAGNLFANAEVGGLPWIWRNDVANSLRGQSGHSPLYGLGVTSWTAMTTADGITCSSVELYETEMSQSGEGDRRSLGTYNAPCVP